MINGILFAEERRHVRKKQVWSNLKVEIRLTPFTAAQKKTLKALIARDPSLASELSLGRLPQSLLESLKEGHINLLPESWDDFSTYCSCPDWANPCKHRAAVYILAGEIDKDPFLLFKLRKMEKEELLQAAGFIAPPKDDAEKPFLFSCSHAARLSFVPYAKATREQEQPPQEPEANRGGKESAGFPLDLGVLAEKQDNMAIFSPSFSFFVISAQRTPPLKGKGEGEEKNQSVPSWDDKSQRFVLKRKRGLLLPAEAVLDLFLSLPLKLPAEQSSPGADFLCAAASLAQALATSASFVPEVRISEANPPKSASKSRSRSALGPGFYIA